MADSFADSVGSLTRVTTGTAANGARLSTSHDDNDDGSDALGPPEPGVHGGLSGTVLGFDEMGTVDPSDDFGGVLVLNFDDNVCVDGTGDDIRIYDVGNDETALIEASADGGNSFVSLGQVVTTNGEFGYQLDLNGALSSVNALRITATDAGVLPHLFAGADIDAVECLNSGTPQDTKAQADGCDLVGYSKKYRRYHDDDDDGDRRRRYYRRTKLDAGIDVEDVVATSDGYTISIQLNLCDEVSRKGIYMVHFDYSDRTNLDGDDVDDGPDTLDHNPRCRRTADRTAIYHRGREKGGMFTVSEDGTKLTLEVDYIDMTKGEGVAPGSKVLFWVETKGRGYVRDHVPTTESGDHCSRPQLAKEVMEITLQ